MASIIHRPDTAERMAELISVLNTNLYSVVPLSKGYKAIVDIIYLKHILQFSWFAVVGRNDTVYAKSTQIVKGKQITLQKYVWGLHTVGHYSHEIGELTFKNKVTLDCRFDNILPFEGRQNVMRYRAKRPSSSDYKGVRRKPNGKYFATISDGVLNIILGTFDSEAFAGKVYDEAAKLIFGDAGYLNFPNEPSDLSAMEVASIRIKRAKNLAIRKSSNPKA